jgi:hypothetical protein
MGNRQAQVQPGAHQILLDVAADIDGWRPDRSERHVAAACEAKAASKSASPPPPILPN